MGAESSVADLIGMTLPEWEDLGGLLAQAGTGAGSMEEVAQRIVRHLYDVQAPQVGHESPAVEPARAFVLVRLYKMHPYLKLPISLMGIVDTALGETPSLTARCLTLLATAGDMPDWNDRTRSAGHQAIPLVNAEMVARAPMISALVKQMGMDATAILQPNPTVFLQTKGSDRVFYVAEAAGSPAIPAQDGFVLRYGIRSVVGFGGVLPSGEMFAVILFSRIMIPRAVAERFARLAQPVRTALIPFTFRDIFSAV
jgi:hypothetical protein